MLVRESVPPADAVNPDDWRTQLQRRYAKVTGFSRLLPNVISFGANAERMPVLEAMRALLDVLDHRSGLPAPLLPGRLIEPGGERPVAAPGVRPPAYADGTVNRRPGGVAVLAAGVLGAAAFVGPGLSPVSGWPLAGPPASTDGGVPRAAAYGAVTALHRASVPSCDCTKKECAPLC